MIYVLDLEYMEGFTNPWNTKNRFEGKNLKRKIMLWSENSENLDKKKLSVLFKLIHLVSPIENCNTI
jgi:hypothetical protein